MRTALRPSFPFVLLMATLLAGNVVADEPAPKLKVDFVNGFDASAAFSYEHDNNKAFRSAMSQAFSGQDVTFVVSNPDAPPALAITAERMLAAMQRAHILHLNVHGNVFDVNGTKTQGIKVAPSPTAWISPQGNSILLAPRVAAALQNGKGPRLVIANGCNLANPDDQATGVNRMSIALGIPNDAKGRAFLGWPYAAKGGARDMQFTEFLTKWTTKQPDGQYPTLEEAWRTTGWEVGPLEKTANVLEGHRPVREPIIVGDKTLRYRVEYLLRPAIGKAEGDTRLPMEWQEDGKDAATVKLFFPEKEIQSLRALGVTLEREPTFLAKREGDALVVRDPRLTRALQSFAETMGKLAGAECQVTVHEFSLSFRPDQEKQKVTVKVRGTSVLRFPDKPAQTEQLDQSQEWVAEPGAVPTGAKAPT